MAFPFCCDIRKVALIKECFDPVAKKLEIGKTEENLKNRLSIVCLICLFSYDLVSGKMTCTMSVVTLLLFISAAANI